jgi:hypothetical protein
MTLRDRKKPAQSAELTRSSSSSSLGNDTKAEGSQNKTHVGQQEMPPTGLTEDELQAPNATEVLPSIPPRKLPRVILRLGPPPGVSSGP